jgi:DNA-binding LytR/AlgR family response regulator
VYFQADNKYTRVVTADGELLIRRSIRELAQELDPGKFWQVHRSTVVNVGEIAEVTRDLHGHLKIRLRNRPEALAVAEAYNHLFKHM